MRYSQLCKLAFICNLCFLATFAGHFVSFIPDSALGSSVIILGQLVAVFLNIFVHIGLLVNRLRKQPWPRPHWLLIANFIILLIQVYYYFFF